MTDLVHLKKEYTQFRKNSGFYTLKGFLYEIPQKDKKALNNCVTQDVLYSNANSCSFGYFLDQKGQLISQINVYKLQDKILLQSRQDLSKVLTDNSIQSQDVTDQKSIIQVEGAQSTKVASQFYQYNISSLKFMHLVSAQCDLGSDKADILLARFGYSGEFGYQFIINQKNVTAFIHKYLQANHIPKVDRHVIDYTNFEVLQPVQKIIDDNPKSSLFELNYGWPINLLSKFNGKKTIESDTVASDKTSVGFKTSADNIKVGMPVYFNDQQVGKVSAVFPALQGNGYVGSAILNDKFAVSGIKFMCNQAVIETISAPYVTPFSWKKNK